MLRVCFGCVSVALCALALGGCARSTSKVPLFRATGTVTYKGQAVPNAKVMFMGDGKSAPAVGVTDDDGRFTLRSLSGAGAPAGKHQVAVALDVEVEAPKVNMSMEEAAKAAQEPPKNSKPRGSVIPSKYANAATSGLEFEIKTSGTNDFTIELKD